MIVASRIAAALLLAATASPAWASSTMVCRSTISPRDGPELWLVLGAAGGVAQARLSLGDERLATGEGARAPVVVQSWLDERQLKLQLADSNVETIITRLDTRRRAGDSYTGILIHRGRTWRVRCTEEG